VAGSVEAARRKGGHGRVKLVQRGGEVVEAGGVGLLDAKLAQLERTLPRLGHVRVAEGQGGKAGVGIEREGVVVVAVGRLERKLAKVAHSLQRRRQRTAGSRSRAPGGEPARGGAGLGCSACWPRRRHATAGRRQ
jgi:hypothetical protein